MYSLLQELVYRVGELQQLADKLNSKIQKPQDGTDFF